MQLTTIYLKKSFFLDKIILLSFFLVISIYAALLSVHTLFSVDLTGGLLGYESDVRRPFEVILGVFIIIFMLGKYVVGLKSAAATFAEFSDVSAYFHHPVKRQVKWADIREIAIEGHSLHREVKFYLQDDTKIMIKLEHIERDSSEFISLMKDFAIKSKITFSEKEPWDISMKTDS